jgi:dTDP-4-dehydrorhamnose 3,5-epimerase
MRSLYVPGRFAHGYQTLEDDTVATYELGEVYTPSAEGGLSHDDPRLGLNWPLPVTAISVRDRNFRPLDEIEGELRRRMLADLQQIEAAQPTGVCTHKTTRRFC